MDQFGFRLLSFSLPFNASQGPQFFDHKKRVGDVWASGDCVLFPALIFRWDTQGSPPTKELFAVIASVRQIASLGRLHGPRALTTPPETVPPPPCHSWLFNHSFCLSSESHLHFVTSVPRAIVVRETIVRSLLRRLFVHCSITQSALALLFRPFTVITYCGGRRGLVTNAWHCFDGCV
jgi:hypothetical protein